MAGTIIADTWQNGDGTQNYKCRAWVNFNGTGTVAIRASGNVSSITDNGTGDYTVNFTTAMVDANYSITRNSGFQGPLTGTPYNTCRHNNVLTTSFRLSHYSSDVGLYDSDSVTVSIFR